MASVNLFVQTSMCVQSADKFQGSRQVRKHKKKKKKKKKPCFQPFDGLNKKITPQNEQFDGLNSIFDNLKNEVTLENKKMSPLTV